MSTEPFEDEEDGSQVGGFGEKKHIPLSEIKRNFELRFVTCPCCVHVHAPMLFPY
jgi:hypothetical protein